MFPNINHYIEIAKEMFHIDGTILIGLGCGLLFFVTSISLFVYFGRKYNKRITEKYGDKNNAK